MLTKGKGLARIMLLLVSVSFAAPALTMPLMAGPTVYQLVLCSCGNYCPCNQCPANQVCCGACSS